MYPQPLLIVNSNPKVMKIYAHTIHSTALNCSHRLITHNSVTVSKAHDNWALRSWHDVAEDMINDHADMSMFRFSASMGLLYHGLNDDIDALDPPQICYRLRIIRTLQESLKQNSSGSLQYLDAEIKAMNMILLMESALSLPEA